MGLVVGHHMVGTQRRRLVAQKIKPLLAGNVTVAEGVAGMVVTHPMVSIDGGQMERDAETDANTMHGIEAERRNEIDLTR